MGVRWRCTPIKTASFTPPGQCNGVNSCRIIRRKRSLNGPCGSWGSSRSWRTLRKPRAALSVCGAARPPGERDAPGGQSAPSSRPIVSWKNGSWPMWEQRFAVAPRTQGCASQFRAPASAGRDSQRPAPRSVANDLPWAATASGGASPAPTVRPGLRGARVELERRLNGTLWLRFRNRYLALHACPQPPRSGKSFRPTASRTRRPKNQPKSKPNTVPPPHHPWRRGGTFLFGRKPDISTLL